jgi:hypothetical protein
MATKTKEPRTVHLRPNARRRPKNVEGMLLAHNHVQHTTTMPIGINGFRAFFFEKGELPHFVPCPCGWRPELGEHYAQRDHVEFVKEERRQRNHARGA